MTRFWSKVAQTGNVCECWIWRANKTRGGYGMFRLSGKMRLAHRVAYELAIGAIPEGLQIDHLCKERSCVNPFHLEPVTAKENTRRGDAPSARHALKTHCPLGHEYTAANLIHRNNGSRQCKVCYRVYYQNRKQRAACSTT